MSIPFPFGKSSLFSLAEFVSRLLGLFFLAHFMESFGLDAGGIFRTALPLVILASAIGSVGLPTALTRWLAAEGTQTQLKSQQVWTITIATLSAMFLTLLTLNAILRLSSIPILGIGPVDSLLQFSVPLILIMPVGGSLRGLMIGRGRNLWPAVAQAAGSIAQVALVNPYTIHVVEHMHWSGGEAGIAIITGAETVGVLVLVFGMLVDGVIRRPRLRLHRRLAQRQMSSSLQTDNSVQVKGVFRELRTIFRLTATPTLQTLLETLGFGLELPMAEHLLTLQFGQPMAEQWMAEYAAVAIPLLHFPMFAADGLATALLPTLTAGRAAEGIKALGPSLQQVVRALFFLSIPSSIVLFVFAPVFSSWLDAPQAANLLRVMAPLALFAYAQSPLSSVVQAQGRSRAMLYAGFLGDISRLSTLFVSMTVWHLGVWGLVTAFAMGVSVESLVLYYFAWRLNPIRIPWRSLLFATLAGVQVCTILILGTHAPGLYNFMRDPFAWFTAALMVGAVFLILCQEVPPEALKPIPLFGESLNRLAKRMAGHGST